MRRQDAYVRLFRSTVVACAIGFAWSSFAWADEPVSPPAPSPTVQEETATPAESGEVQERAVIRDHRTQPGIFTPSPTTPPPPVQLTPRIPKVMVVPGVTGPTTGTPAPLAPGPSAQSIVIYEHPNFGGRSQTLGVGEHRLSDFNDIVSSIKVPNGLVAVLYEHADAGGGYGIAVDLLEDRPDLSQVSFNDKLSYVRVFSSPTPQGFIWARASVQNGQFVAGHWERQRASGTPVNIVAVVSPPFPPNPPGVQPATGAPGPIVRDHRTPPPGSGPDFDVAYYHAPIHYQDTNSKKYRGDYITRFEYDGDWLATNNWDNLTRFPLAAYAYYSVVETCSHWYIVYGFYHPQDWAGPGGQEHEGDMEGVLSIVRKDGSRFGKLEGMVTVFHLDFYSYTPTDSSLRDGPVLTINVPGQPTPISKREDIDGQLRMQAYDGSLHSLTNQEDKGHGLKAFPNAGNFLSGNGGDGIIYFPSRTSAEVPQSGNDRDVKYRLLDIFAPNGLWDHQLMDIRTERDHRAMGPTFHSWGTYRGDKSGGCGDGITITCKENSPHTPWGWDDTGFSVFSGSDYGVYSGEMALDPAHLAAVYFTGPGGFSQKYLRNRYLSDLRSRGYGPGNLPKGWPSGLNLTQLFTKLGTSCP